LRTSTGTISSFRWKNIRNLLLAMGSWTWMRPECNPEADVQPSAFIPCSNGSWRVGDPDELHGLCALLNLHPDIPGASPERIVVSPCEPTLLVHRPHEFSGTQKRDQDRLASLSVRSLIPPRRRACVRSRHAGAKLHRIEIMLSVSNDRAGIPVPSEAASFASSEGCRCRNPFPANDGLSLLQNTTQNQLHHKPHPSPWNSPPVLRVFSF